MTCTVDNMNRASASNLNIPFSYFYNKHCLVRFAQFNFCHLQKKSISVIFFRNACDKTFKYIYHVFSRLDSEKYFWN